MIALDCLERSGRAIEAEGRPCRPLCSLPPVVHAMVERQMRNQELSTQAVLGGDRRLALQAVQNDPFTGRLAVNEIEKMFGGLPEADHACLPVLFEKLYAGSSSV